MLKHPRPLPGASRALYLPPEPLLLELKRFDNNGELAALARRAGVSERAIYRYRYGESARVRIDVADRLAIALGATISMIWNEY